MLYRGRRGSQAEVIDGGQIKRLPFSGEGKEPTPGSRIIVPKNDCCCPTSVPLDDHPSTEPGKRPDPRRDITGKEQPKPYRGNKCFGIANDGDILDFMKKLKGKNYKLLLFAEDMPNKRCPLQHILWNAKTDNYSIVTLSNSVKILDCWVNITWLTIDSLGTGGTYYIWQREFGKFFEAINDKKNLHLRIKDINRKVKTTYRIFDAGRKKYIPIDVNLGTPIPDPVHTNGNLLSAAVSAYGPRLAEPRNVENLLYTTRDVVYDLDAFHSWYHDPPEYQDYAEFYRP